MNCSYVIRSTLTGQFVAQLFSVCWGILATNSFVLQLEIIPIRLLTDVAYIPFTANKRDLQIMLCKGFFTKEKLKSPVWRSYATVNSIL